MLITIALIVAIVIFCYALQREENRRESKRNKSDRNSQQNESEVEDNETNTEVIELRKQLLEKDEIINRLRNELNESQSKMDTYLSVTKTSQELVLRNDDRVKTVSKLWEEKNEQLDRVVLSLTAQVVQLKAQIEKADDELNSHQHKAYNVSRLLADSENRVLDLESQLEQLFEVEDKCHQKSQRIQQLQADIEHMEELRRKDSDKYRQLVKEKDLKIEQLENVCSELRITTAVTSL